MVWTVGCANFGLTIQPVEDEPFLLVGLASSPDGSAEAESLHDHPVEWTTGALNSVLKRLAIQEGRGFLDSSRPPQ